MLYYLSYNHFVCVGWPCWFLGLGWWGLPNFLTWYVNLVGIQGIFFLLGTQKWLLCQNAFRLSHCHYHLYRQRKHKAKSLMNILKKGDAQIGALELFLVFRTSANNKRKFCTLNCTLSDSYWKHASFFLFERDLKLLQKKITLKSISAVSCLKTYQPIIVEKSNNHRMTLWYSLTPSLLNVLLLPSYYID